MEKGLSIRSPRPGFGKDVIQPLCYALGDRLRNGLPWTQACQDGLDSLVGYVDFNRQRGGFVIPEVAKVLELSAQMNKASVAKPIRAIDREQIHRSVNFNTEDFFSSRHSVRQFEPGTIDITKLRKALAHALTTPSVCNRQSGRVWIAIRNDCNLDFLALQNGNRGFGHEAQAIAIITSDLSAFLDPTERHQAMVDGGMFAMMVALGLHAEGFGACFLNWSQTDAIDLQLRRATGIPASETVITLLAVGNLPEQLSVARSHRLDVDDVVKFLHLPTSST